MLAAEFDLEIEEGSDFQQDFQFVDSLGAPIDITGATATGQIRKNINDVVGLVDLSFAVDGPTGTLSVKLANTANQNFPFEYPAGQEDEPLVCAYDVFFVDTSGTVAGIAGKKYKLLKGEAKIYPQVTR